jgi:hypothetical protein
LRPFGSIQPLNDRESRYDKTHSLHSHFLTGTLLRSGSLLLVCCRCLLSLLLPWYVGQRSSDRGCSALTPAVVQFGKLKNAYPRTHVIAYFISLLVANTIQASGTALSLRWIMKGLIEQDMFCQLQGTSHVQTVAHILRYLAQGRRNNSATLPRPCGTHTEYFHHTL